MFVRKKKNEKESVSTIVEFTWPMWVLVQKGKRRVCRVNGVNVVRVQLLALEG
jgi:hypothetical protein